MCRWLKQLCFCFVAAWLGVGGFAFAETIVFKSGKIIKAPLLSCSGKQIKISYQGRELFYDLIFLESIDGMNPEVYFLESAGSEHEKVFSYRKDIDYGLDTRIDRIVAALCQELSFPARSPRMKSVEQVTEEFFNGSFHSNYRLYFAPDDKSVPDWDYENMMEEFRQVVSIDPYASLFYYEAVDKVRLRQELYDEVLYLEKAVGQNSADADSDMLLELGLTHFMCARPDRAIPYFEKAIEKDSDRVEAYGFLGLAYCSEGEFEKGRQQLSQAYRLFCQQGRSGSSEDIKFLLSHIP